VLQASSFCRRGTVDTAQFKQYSTGLMTATKIPVNLYRFPYGFPPVSL